VHNNGTYFDKDAKHLTAVFQGKSYEFEHGRPVQFAFIDLFFAIYDCYLDFADALNAHPEIMKMPYRRMLH
jgi:hypothetical protein